MKLNSTNHCDCDNHGRCVRYKQSSYEASEILLHQSWNQYQTLQNSLVCQCDPGWTGYGDFGVFQHEALLNCATNTIFIKVIWGLGIVGYTLWWITAIQFTCKVSSTKGRKDRGKMFFMRPIIRVVGSSSGLYLSVYKAFGTQKETALMYSPFNVVLIGILVFFFIYEVVVGDLKQLHRFVTGTLKDFGLLSNDEQKQIKHVGFILKLHAVICAVFFSVFGSSNNEVLWSIACAVGLSQTTVVNSILALYIKPRTFRRLLKVLNNMVKHSESLKNKGDYTALNVSSDELQQKLLTIQQNISIQYRVPKYVLIMGILTHSPFLVFPQYWKYAGYLAVLWTMYSVTTGTFIILAFLRGRKKRNRVLSMKNQQQVSSSASAFQSTHVLASSKLSTS